MSHRRIETLSQLERSGAVVYTEACKRFLQSLHAPPNTAWEKESALCDAIQEAWPDVVKMLEEGKMQSIR